MPVLSGLWLKMDTRAALADPAGLAAAEWLEAEREKAAAEARERIRQELAGEP